MSNQNQFKNLGTTELSESAGRARLAIFILVLAAALVIPIIVIHATNLRALVSFHGFIHAAILDFWSPFSLAPENPFYAGETLKYYWFFQAWSAATSGLFGLDPMHALESTVLSGLVLLVAAGVALGHALYRSPWRGVLLVLLALVGGNLLGPVILAFRWVIGDGSVVLPGNPLNPVGYYRFGSQAFLSNYGPNYPYFFQMTSKGVALGFLMVTLWFLWRSHKSPGPKNVVLVALFSGLMNAMSPLVGLCGVGALGLVYLFQVFRSWRSNPRSETEPTWTWGTMFALGIGPFLALPTYYHLFGIAGVSPQFVLFEADGAKFLVMVIVGAGPMIFLALRARRCPLPASGDNGFIEVMFIAGILLLAASICVHLPVDNNNSIYLTAIVLLSIPAAGFARTSTRLWILGALMLTTVPSFVFLMHTYTGRAPVEMTFKNGLIARTPADSEISRLYTWISQHTEKDAIIVVNPRRKIRVVGNVFEAPAMTQRPLLIGSRSYMTWIGRYTDSALRWDTSIRITSGRALTEDQEQLLENMNRPIYIVSDRSIEELPRMLGKPVFSGDRIVVYRWYRSGE